MCLCSVGNVQYLENLKLTRLCFCYNQDTDTLEVGLREDKAVGVISTKTYYHYFKAGGGYLFPLLVFVLFVLGEV